MTWVFQSSRATGSDRLVLLAIADRTNDEGQDAWPSIRAVAEKARMNERTVHRSLVRLEALGELQVERRPGRASVYTIVMQPSLSLPTAPAGRAPKRAVTPDRLSPLTDCHPRQSVTPDNVSPLTDCRGDSGVTPRTPSTGTSTSVLSTSTHTHRARARAGSPAAAPPTKITTSEAEPLAVGRPSRVDRGATVQGGGCVASGPHRSHAACMDPCCVPASLHREFVRKSGLVSEAEADEQVRAWYREVSDAWAGQPVGEDDFAWWRARWKERMAGRPTNRWGRSRQPPTEGPWGDMFEHLVMLLGRHAAHEWFRGVRITRETDEAVVLEVPTDLQRDWIRGHYLEQLQAAVATVRPGRRVELDLAEAA